MAATPYQITPRLQTEGTVERWFFTWMALAMIVTSLAAFVPSIVHSVGRHAPLSSLAAAHGIVFLAWLLLFLVQSRLIATRHVPLHRGLGLASVFILASMIPLAYTTTISMVRRGFDLSGDLRIDRDPASEAVFALSNLLIFSALAIAALACRHKPEVHKRLMLFANIELMPAPLAHLIGHTPWLASRPAPIVMIPISIFVVAAIARDLLVARRIHVLTWSLAALRIVSGPIEAGPIGSSASWHKFVYWLAR
jgi:FtsH-binding integral membrane protein